MLLPTPHDVGENPEVHKDWEEIRGRKEKIPEEEQVEKEEDNQKLEVLAALKPLWIKGNQQAEAIWQDFVTEFLDAKINLNDADSAVAAEYFNHYFRIILGELAERFLPKTILNDHDGFGRKSWEDAFYAGGDHTKLQAAQYLSPRNILEFRPGDEQRQGEYFYAIRSTHFNLCGQLAVIEAMGISLPQGMRIFYEEVDDRDGDGNYTLGNPSVGTYAADLIYFILAVAKRQDENWSVEHLYLASSVNRLEALDKLLESNEIVIALVNIDPSLAGEGRVGVGGQTAHWVVLQDIFDLAGETFVRIYNPFMNREEIYLWETFDSGWEMAELNSAPRLIWGRKRK